MKRADYFSDADSLDGSADASRGQLAEIKLPGRNDQVLSRHGHHQLNADLVGAVFAKFDNQRRGTSAGSAACVDRDIQPVPPGRFAPQLPRIGRAGAKLHGRRVLGEGS